ncbi:MAG TPA: redoxin domain-containing protein, partial [Anaerolineales bacterium]|nr:redoxin domain-containing protein [Anaerolineales bacterium]
DEPLKDVTEFVNDLGLTFEILMDPGSTVNDRYQIRAYPTSFFVGRDGTIVSLQIGSMTESQLEENLAKILPK